MLSRNRTTKSHGTIIGTNSIVDMSPKYGIANNTSADISIAFNSGIGVVTISSGTIWIFESAISPISSTIEITSTVAETITYII